MIPQFCILGFLPKLEFKALCVDKGILNLTTDFVDDESKFRVSELSLRSDSHISSPLYHHLPAGPPPRPIYLTPSKGQTIQSQDKQQIGEIEAQMHLLSLD